MWHSKNMKIKQAVNTFKRIAPLVPVFGNWKAATAVFALIQYGAPMAMKYLTNKKRRAEADKAEKTA